MLHFSAHPRPSSLDFQRDRYLRALAEEQAARSSYAAAVAYEQQLQAAERRRVEALRRQHVQRANPFFVYAPEASYNGYCGSPYTSSPSDYDEYIRALRQQEQLEKLRVEAETRQRREEEQRRVLERARDAARRHNIKQAIRNYFASEGAELEKAQREQKPELSQPSSVPVTFYRSPSPQPAAPTTSSAAPTQSPEVEEAAAKIQAKYRAVRTRRNALASIAALAAQVDALTSAFTLPAIFEFASAPAAASDAAAVPRLAYTHANAPVHAHEDALLRVLQALDAVDSAGDAHVRAARRALVKRVERELEQLDKQKALAWSQLCLEVAGEQAMEVEAEAQPETPDDAAAAIHAEPDMVIDDAHLQLPESEDSTGDVDTTMDAEAELSSSSAPTPAVAGPAADDITPEPEFAVNVDAMEQSLSLPSSLTAQPIPASHAVLTEPDAIDPIVELDPQSLGEHEPQLQPDTSASYSHSTTGTETSSHSAATPASEEPVPSLSMFLDLPAPTTDVHITATEVEEQHSGAESGDSEDGSEDEEMVIVEDALSDAEPIDSLEGASPHHSSDSDAETGCQAESGQEQEQDVDTTYVDNESRDDQFVVIY